MKLQTALSENGEQLFLVLNMDEQIVIDMDIEQATELMKLLFDLIKEAKAQQSFIKMEASHKS